MPPGHLMRSGVRRATDEQTLTHSKVTNVCRTDMRLYLEAQGHGCIAAIGHPADLVGHGMVGRGRVMFLVAARWRAVSRIACVPGHKYGPEELDGERDVEVHCVDLRRMICQGGGDSVRSESYVQINRIE